MSMRASPPSTNGPPKPLMLSGSGTVEANEIASKSVVHPTDDPLPTTTSAPWRS